MGKNKTTPAERRHGRPEPTPEQPPKRSRSQKDRPGTVEELELAIREDRLDLRTRESQQLVAVRNAIAANPTTVATGAVRDILAMNVVISAAIARHLTKPGAALIDAEGTLSPLVAKHLELQKSTLSAARTLAALEGKGDAAPTAPPDAPAPVDVSSIVLQLSEEQQHNPLDIKE